MSFLQLPLRPLYSLNPSNGTDDAVAGDGGGDDDAAVSSLNYWSLAATVAFTVAVFLLEEYLNSRQRRTYLRTKFPAELQLTVSAIDEEREKSPPSSSDSSSSSSDNKDTKKSSAAADDDAAKSNKDKVDMDKPLLPQLQSKFSKAQSYGFDKINFGSIANTYDTYETVAFLLLGYFPWAWDQSCILGYMAGEWTEREDEIKISIIFLIITTLVSTFTSLPFELYSTFQIERKHGFNKQTIGLFVSDKIKSLVLTFLIGSPFIALLLYIIKNSGEYFYLYVWAFMFVFSAFMMTIVPTVIMPLFNKYEPLEDGALKTSIEELAASIDYPLKKLFVMDGSKRSAHSNAFMFGFGSNKRIVLFDTLMEQVSSSEILAILGGNPGCRR